MMYGCELVSSSYSMRILNAHVNETSNQMALGIIREKSNKLLFF